MFIDEFETIYPETRKTINDEAGDVVLSLNRCCIITGSEVRQDLGWNFRVTAGSTSIVFSVAGAQRLHSILGQLIEKIEPQES